MQTGLWSKKGSPVPLVNVNISGKISHFCAQITIAQTYRVSNASESAVFRFPLDMFGALCGFEVIVDGRTMTSQVKKRTESSLSGSSSGTEIRRTESVSDDNLADIFICDLGNLAPEKEIEFRLTYITELSLEDDALRFFLPGIHSSTQYKLGISLEIEPFSNIESVTCPTHDVEVETAEDRATLKLNKGSSREGHLVVLMKLKKVDKIWSTIEYDEKNDSYATMIAFHPNIDHPAPQKSELIVLVDCSSVGAMALIRSSLVVLLRHLKSWTYFNIILFGSSHHKIFESSVETDEAHLETARLEVEKLSVISSHGINIFSPLSDVLSTSPVEGVQRSVFVFTGGLIPNTQEVLNLVSEQGSNTRFFTFGIGDHFSHLSVVGIARAGSGASEFITGKSGENDQEPKIARQVQRAMQPALTNLVSEGIELSPKRSTLYNKDNVLLYAFLPHDVRKRDIMLKVTGPNGEIALPLELNLDSAQKGKSINVLAARSKMRDLEALEDDEGEEEIVRLGTTFQLASNFTSFVAEKAEKTKLSLNSSIDMYASREVSQDEDEHSSTRSDSPPVPLTPSASGRKVYPADFLLRFRPLCTDMPEGLSQNLGVIVTPFNNKSNNTGNNSGSKSPMVKGKGRGGHRRTDSRDNKNSKGRNNNNSKNPNLSVAPLEATEGRWEPSAKNRVKDQTVYDETWRKVQGILNKLTLIKYDELYKELLAVGISDIEMLEATINLIFHKAVTEQHFCTMYANLCFRLTTDLPSFPGPDDKPVNFRTLLLTKCQLLFESKILPNQQELPSDPLEREEMQNKIKRKTLGNIKFIGELYKEKMLSRVVMHECIRTLLTDMENPKEEDIESLCQLLMTIGKDLDTATNSEVMAQYYSKMATLKSNMNLPSRIRFMLQGVLEFRANGWNKPKGGDLRSSQESNRSSDSLRASQERNSPPSSPQLRRSGGGGRGLSKSQSADVVADEWETPKGSRRSGGRGNGPSKLNSSQDSQWEVAGRGKGHARRSSSTAAPVSFSPGPSRFAPKKTEEPKVKANPFSALSEDTPPGTPRSALRKSGATGCAQKGSSHHGTQGRAQGKHDRRS